MFLFISSYIQKRWFMKRKFKIKKLLKRIAVNALAVFTMAGSAGTAISPIKVTPVHAESGRWEAKNGGDIGYYKMNYNDNSGALYSSGQMGALTANGEIAFCVNAHVEFKNGVFTSRTPISGDLAAYAYYGKAMPEENGLTRTDYRIGAQTLVWKSLYPNATFDAIPGNGQAAANAIVATYNAEKATNNYTGWSYSGTGGQDAVTGTKTPKNIDVPVSASVHKYSEDESVTKNNPNYSLAGAKFSVKATLRGKELDGTITTDKDGNGSWSGTFKDMPADTKASEAKIDIKETDPSKGFKLYTKPLNGSSGYKAEVPEPDINDPLGISITKKNNDNEAVPNAPSLEGAKFTLKFYPIDPTV